MINRAFFILSAVCLLLLAAGSLATRTPTLSQSDVSPTPTPDYLTQRVMTEGDAERGQELFTTVHESVGFACSTCHLTDSEQRLIGPGLLNVRERAAERVERQSAALYLYIAIIRPDAYIVADYPSGLMPQTFDSIFHEQDLYDLIAYLLTLDGDPVETGNAAATPAAGQAQAEETGELPDPEAVGDPASGEVLFRTFQSEVGFMCATCHWTDTEDRLIGPGPAQRSAARTDPCSRSGCRRLSA
jgi:cytochrome c2